MPKKINKLRMNRISQSDFIKLTKLVRAIVHMSDKDWYKCLRKAINVTSDLEKRLVPPGE